MAKRLRLAVATALVAIPAGTGLGMAPGFAAEEASGVQQTTGGCWTYVPEADLAQPLPFHQRAVQSDAVDPWTPWSMSPAGAHLDLRSSGANAKDGKRTVELTLSDGPVLSADADVNGWATAHFIVTPVGGNESDTPVSFESDPVAFEAGAGAPVTGLTVMSAFDLQEGKFRLDLQSIYFQDADNPLEVTVCNGQTERQPSLAPEGEGNLNPATSPEPTSATLEFEALPARSLGINSVAGQQEEVTYAARAGDVLAVRVAGLDSDSEFRLQLAGATVAPLANEAGQQTFVVDEAGRGEVDVVVPETAPTQAVALQLVQDQPMPSVVNDIPLTILSAPQAAATEKVNEDALEVVLAGAEWDPRATVKVVPMAGDSPSEDAEVTFRVAEGGTFAQRVVLTDTETDALAITQERPRGFEALKVSYGLMNAVPATPVEPAPADPTPPSSTETPPVSETPPASTTPPSTVTPPTSVTPPATPPVEVPLPDELPMNEVDAPAVSGTEEGVLQVSEATLAGETSLGELFGGPSRRDVRILVENTGSSMVSNPLVRLGVGRDGDVQPALVAAEVGDLQPGARVMVSVDVALPMASFGTYQVVGQVGEDEGTKFQLRWDTYPWGLIVLNLAGVALLAWGVSRRRRGNAPTPLAGAGDEDSASVVDLHALDEWWTRGKVARVPVAPVVALEDDSDSIVDLDAAEAFWAKRGSKVS